MQAPLRIEGINYFYYLEFFPNGQSRLLENIGQVVEFIEYSWLLHQGDFQTI